MQDATLLHEILAYDMSQIYFSRQKMSVVKERCSTDGQLYSLETGYDSLLEQLFTAVFARYFPTPDAVQLYKDVVSIGLHGCQA